MIEDEGHSSPPLNKMSWLDKIIRFCLENKFIVALAAVAVVFAGIMFAPFDWDAPGIPRKPVAVDAIPDIGENQQIVFTEWMGRSPKDVDDQVTYPLTISLMGMPEVKTIRSSSMFGLSFIYIIFKDNAEFYWSRSRVLEKLNSLPPKALPDGVTPRLGPDATGVGQIFWYTLEGRDPDGNPAGGWDLQELRSIQDWQVRYALLAATDEDNNKPISEVSSVGGYIKEYQVDVDPAAMDNYGINLDQVFKAIRMSNVDVGAKTIEVNKVEYVIRGLGFIKSIDDIENTVLKVNNNVPISIRDVAKVTLGPALRRGVLDKEGSEAVGGVVVVRYGENPLSAIKAVKEKISEIAPGLPTKPIIDYTKTSRIDVEDFTRRLGFDAYDGTGINKDAWLTWLRNTHRDKWPEWITTSHVTVVPFYDRTGLIYETLGTLNRALVEEILVTIIVVIVLVLHLRSSVLISGLLPMAVLMCFVAMKAFGVDANIVALSGIAIAIGTMVDMGIIICENILKHLDEADPRENKLEVVFRASREVGGAVLTAVSTTIISFLPVFTMVATEGKLFKPLALTKTFALISSVIVALTVIPPAAHLLFARKTGTARLKKSLMISLIAAGIVIGISLAWWAGAIIAALGIYHLISDRLPPKAGKIGPYIVNTAAVLIVGIILTRHWLPLGPDNGLLRNMVFVTILIGGLLSFFYFFQKLYPHILRWFLAHKVVFISIPIVLVIFGVTVWLGVDRTFGFMPETFRRTALWKSAEEKFPGLGKEFMPKLDEGSFLYMPTTSVHASIGEAADVLQKEDMAIKAVPEVETVVGKIGRVESPLDPAPISMMETVVIYKPEYITDKDGHRIRFRFDTGKEEFVRDENNELIPDKQGSLFRQWRSHIKSPRDIWNELEAAARVPGTTPATLLHPIETRRIMLQTGMRSPIGIKVKGPDLKTIEKFGIQLERLLKEVPSVDAERVFADRIVGKPYLEVDIDREALKPYGLHIRNVQDVIEVAIGGRLVTTTVEGRERYPVRVRYMRELRDQPDTIGKILVPTPGGAQIPLGQLAKIRFVRGPMVIKSEDAFYVGHVLFDKRPGYSEVGVVEDCERYLAGKIEAGELVVPDGVSYSFAGNYENQVRSQKTLLIVLPLALFLIFLILYLQFRSVATTGLVFSGIIVAWAGGFIMIWLYARPSFLNFSIFGTNMRELFQVNPINLSVAIWVGFLALFGIASDNGVVIATYLDQSFARSRIASIKDIREATIAGATRRIRPCLMTSATTILALIPVLTSTGRGSDIMVPMAIPSFGGMLVVLVSVFVVPVLYCGIKEMKFRFGKEILHK